MNEIKEQELTNVPMTIMLTKSQKEVLRIKAFEHNTTMTQLLRNVIISTLNLK